MTRRPGEQLKESLTGGAITFGNHLDPAVVEVRRTADQTEFERPRAHPPTKAHALHPASDPSGQPDRLAPNVAGMSPSICTDTGTGIATVAAHGSTVTPPVEPMTSGVEPRPAGRVQSRLVSVRLPS